MSVFRCFVFTMMTSVFVLFSLNTWLFLEQSMSSEYRRQLSIVALRRRDDDQDSTTKKANPNIGDIQRYPGGHHSMIRLAGPLGVKRIKHRDSLKRMVSYCKAVLAKGSWELTDDGESSDHEEFINRGFDLDHPKDKQKIPAEKKTRSRTNIRTKSDRKEREILKHSLVLRTDDNKTIQTTPWGFPPDECSEKDYGPITDLPTVSVIICFHEHENIADVLHTVHSVVQRTPRQLVKEILLVDDNSKKEDFKQILEKYVSAVFTGQIVRIIRSERHMGLIQCRLHGAQLAQGDVLYFMDSHMEVQPRWLEPLLWEIKTNPSTLASSFLDWIKLDDSGNWSYTHGGSSWKTYFDWNLVFGFQTTSQQAKSADLTLPVISPVTVGGVFAISKTFFFHVGAFDEGMCGWGGENLDLPIRVWLFGGRVLNVPCSHVGHLETISGRNYRLSWQHQTNVNYKRIIDVWLPEHDKYVYYYNPSLKTVDPGNLTGRLELRNKTSRTFGWILENVFPELGFYDKNTFAWDGLRNLHFNTCLSAVIPHTNPYLSTCNKNDTLHQAFFLNELGELRFPIHIFNDYSGQLHINEYIQYYNVGSASRWIHWPGGPMQCYSSNQCLEATETNTVLLTACDKEKSAQRWKFNTYSNKLYSILRTKPAKKKNYYWYTLYMEHIQTEGNLTI